MAQKSGVLVKKIFVYRLKSRILLKNAAWLEEVGYLEPHLPSPHLPSTTLAALALDALPFLA